MFRLVETDGSGNLFKVLIFCCGKMIRKKCEWMMIKKSEIEK